MKIIKLTIILLTIALLASFGCQKEELEQVRIASLKGPTTIGLVKLIDDAEKGRAAGKYKFDIYGTADEIVPLLVNGDIDMAMLPCNLAGVLYNKTGGGFKIAAVNTLGVLYIVENGDTIHSLSDLKGKKIYSTGKGTTPEYVFNHILVKNGLDPQKDLEIEYKSEATELAVFLDASEKAIVLLPQPYATSVLMKNERARIALDMTEEWDKTNSEGSLVTGVLLVNASFAMNHQVELDMFLEEYKASTSFVDSDIEKAAELVVRYGIIADAKIAAAAIPYCNITYIVGDEMKSMVSGYLKVLFESNPQSIGGKLPGDDFYYEKK